MIILLSVLLACTSRATDDTATVDPEFIAFPKDFAGFLSWRSFDVGSLATDGLATVAPRVVYLNAAPPSGSQSFPVGTLLVKVVGDGTSAIAPTFAMAKRGAGFDAEGASGWEWFELQAGSDGTLDASPVIVWRGTAPPVGSNYSGNGGCNTCHVDAASNDYVPSTELSLSGF